VFRALINDAKSAAGAVIGKYAIRASVAVPFVVAVGFGIAALTLALVERFGAITGYAIMAGGFAAIGLIAAAVVAVKEQEEAVADTVAEKQDTANVAGNVAADAAAQVAAQAPLALLSALLTTPLVPSAMLSGIKVLGRNVPLVVLIGLAVLLFWPKGDDEEAVASEASDQDGADATAADAGQPPPSEAHRHAA
jgi:hypothetical protein